MGWGNWGISFAQSIVAAFAPPPPVVTVDGSFLVLESGDNLLLEDGNSIVLEG